MINKIKKAIQILSKGGIVIFPTDTAFAIGCRIDDEKAVKKLFNIRKRPPTQAAPVLVSDLKMAQKYLEKIPQDVKEKLINRYWPGALTIVLPCLKEKVPDLVRGGSDNLGVRMPDHPVALEIIKKTGVPILGPSANFHGQPTPFSYENLDKELVKLVDFVLEGECSKKQPACHASQLVGVAGRASTVVDCSIKPWKILRQGAVRLMQAILLIDTTSNKTIKAGLVLTGEKYTIEQKLDKHKAQILLPLIEKILQEKNIKLQDLTEIQANPGPGSFTGIRVGLTIANTLAFLLKIPINGKPLGEMAKPIY